MKKMNVKGARLGAKLTNIALAVVLVLGMSPATKAVAATNASGNADVAATAAQSLGVATDAAAADGQASDQAADSAATAGDAAGATDAAATEGTIARASTGADGVAADAAAATTPAATAYTVYDTTASAKEASVDSDQPATKQATESNEANTPAYAESDIMLLSDTGYNADADPVDVSGNCTAEAHLYTDQNRQNEVSSTNAVTAGSSLYGTLNIQFTGAVEYTPTYAHPNVTYKLPDNMSFNNVGTKDLYDGSTYAGTWELTNNVLTIKYAESYLSQIVKHFNFNFEGHLTKTNVGDGASEVVKFPGQGTGITIPYKDGSVTGNKWSSFNSNTNQHEWTVELTVGTYATNLTLVDTIGSNLKFVSGSFKLNGNSIDASALTVNGQTATIKLGNCDAGKYTITYTTGIVSLPTTNGTDLADDENSKNTAKWTWGVDPHEDQKTVGPASVKFNMVQKNNGTQEGSYIKWNVVLNNGTLKADMSSYTFKDTLGGDQVFADGKGVKVTYKDDSWNDVTVAVTPEYNGDKTELTFTLPKELGKKELYIEYYSAPKDASKDAANLTNEAQVTPPDKNYPEGSGSSTGSYGVPKDQTSVSKSLNGSVKTDSKEYDGKASWKTVVGFSKSLSTTDASTIVVSDYFSSLPKGVKVALDGDVELTYQDGDETKTLTAGTDYAITKAPGEVAAGEENPLFTITFKSSAAVKALLGKTDVTISYGTITSKLNGSYENAEGEYKNAASLQVGTSSKKSSESSYTVAKEPDAPQVNKTGSYTNYDADYTFADGSKGAFISTWTAYVNMTWDEAHNDWSMKPVLNLAQKDVTVEDTLPADSELVKESASYKLRTSAWDSKAEGTPTISTQNGKATFTVPTNAVSADTKVYVELTYKTATKASAIQAGNEGTTITNYASAGDGTHSFPAGEGKVTITNKMLDKTSNQDTSTNVVSYTIKVNESESKLNGGNAITLEDTMDHRGSLINGSLKVVDKNGTDLLANGTVTYRTKNISHEDGSSSIQLIVTVPDSTFMTVTYNVMPSQSSTQEEPFTNKCELVGLVNSSEVSEKQIVVTKSDADTSAVNYGFTINKTDDQGTKKLAGAEFDLYRVDMDKSEAGEPSATKVGSATTDKTGKASFGSQSEPLDVDTLYYFVETKAPANYKADSSKHYVMLKGTDEAKYQTAYEKAVALKMTPTAATSYDIYNEKVDGKGSASISVYKTVNGGSKAVEGEEFEFTLYEAADYKANGEKATALGTVKTQAGSVASFEDLELTAGTYNYVIHEVGHNDNGWTAASDVDVTVVATENKDNGIDFEYQFSNSYTDEGKGIVAAAFDNKYSASCNADIKVSKTVVGGTSQTADETFDFQLKDADGKVVDTVTGVKDGGTASFDAKKLGFTTADAGKTFNYTVTEIGHNSDGWKASADVKVAVTVVENADRSLSAKVVYNGDEKVTAAKFTNTYSTTGSATISVYKTVNGGTEAKPGEKFTFELYKADESGKATGEKLGTVETEMGKVASFENVKLDKEGTYTYVIKETGHNDNGWTAAADVTAKVTATDDGKGNLKTSVEYSSTKEGVAGFDNKYEAKGGSATIGVEKTVNGKAIATGEKFTFQLYKGSVADANKVGKEITATKDAPKANFDAIELTEAGTFTYVVHETADLGDGWTNDSDFTVTLTVEDVNGAYKVTSVKYNDEKRGYDSDGAYIAKFDNKYEPETPGEDTPENPNNPNNPGEAQIGVYKTVNGGTEAKPGEKFEFQLIDKDGNVVDTVTTEMGKVAYFDNKKFDLVEVGTHTFTIHEVGHNDNGWIAASDVTATVVVSKANGKTTATVTYSNTKEGVAGFDNKYEETPKDTTSKTTNNSSSNKTTSTKTGDPMAGVVAGVAGVAAIAGAAAVHVRRKQRNAR
jgi:pilin isopeptide linkage protein